MSIFNGPAESRAEAPRDCETSQSGAPQGGDAPRSGDVPQGGDTPQGGRRGFCLSTLATALQVLRGHWVYVVIYLVALSLMGVFIAVGSVKDTGEQDAAVVTRPQAAVIDRDNSAVSQGVRAYMGRHADLVELEDSERALQDAAAEDRVDYILVVPQGYGDDLVAAAQAGLDAPALQAVTSFRSAAGSLMDVRVTGYLRSVYGFAAVLGADQAEAVRLADQATAGQTDVALARTSDTPLATRLRVYLGFSTYPLFAAITLCIALMMKAFNRREVRQRLLVAPTASANRSVQVFAACLAVGVVSWLWVAGLGVALFGRAVAEADPGRVLLACLALLAYALFAVAIGFLLGQLGVKEQAANAIANVGGLVMSFLGGAWVGIDMMPEAVAAAARLTPSYWAISAIDGVLFLEDPLAALGSIGIAALFAGAVFVVALAVGRVRVREE